MFDKFSKSALRVVFWARAEAGRSGSEAIEPEHMLLGVLAEYEGEYGRAQEREALFLHEVSQRTIPQPRIPFFTPEQVTALRRILDVWPQPDTQLPLTDDMPLAQTTERILMAAQEQPGASLVRPLHILRALVNESAHDVSRVLIANGVTREQIDEQLRGC
jgi:ATP-dependent Clp protease ATP-binding subunit ClpA